ncbi:hypothetical protein AURDEDRAFT_159665 [Auricularia subglabra TFB-10046 SS5]|nr:hypothetical protein AURDEDRAFT_159665 [Auricularia subglabra TFB-10046 SS5]
MSYPAAPRLPTIPLPRIDARRRASTSPTHGSNDALPSVHDVLECGLIYDTSIASSSSWKAFTTAGRPLTPTILDAPAALPHRNQRAAAVSLPALHANVFIGCADGRRFVTVRDVLDAIDAALQRPVPCPHDRAYGCAACSVRHADLFGTRFVRVHVQSTSVGDFSVSLFAQPQ